MSSFKTRLKRMKKNYTEQKQTAKDMFTLVPAGVYVGVLQSAKIAESSNGNLLIKREHLITEGDESGSTVFDNMMLETELGFAFIIRWLEICGYEAPETPEEIEDIIEAMTDENPGVKFSIKHSGNYANVSVQELLEAGEASESDSSSDEVEEEDDEVYTAEDINGMAKPDLVDLITENELDIKTKGVKVTELRDAIIEELGLGEAEEKEEEEKDEVEPEAETKDEGVNAEEIKTMKKQDVIDLIDDNKIPVDYEKIKSIKALRQAVIDYLEDEEEAEAEDSETDEEFDALKEFCVAQDLGDEFKTKQEMKDEISLYKWPEDEMTDGELAMFKTYALEEYIVKSKTKKKIIVRKKTR